LDPLPRQSLEELLHDLLGGDPTLDPVKEFLIRRTEGNPFFAEEIVQTLVETQVLSGGRGRHHLVRPLSGVKLPPMVQDVIAARIDRLPSEEKRLIREASVIGKDVPLKLLQMVAACQKKTSGGMSQISNGRIFSTKPNPFLI
jgi:adenylate cyclase